MRADGVSAARADRLRRARAPSASSRRRAAPSRQPARRGRAGRRASASPRPASRNCGSSACISGRTAATSLRRRHCSTLLRALDTAPGDVPFRISSLEPMDCRPEVVDLVATSGRFAPHFHLPLQHGSDRMLARHAAAVHPRSLRGAGRCTSARACRTPPSAPTSSSGFPGETGRRCGRGRACHRGLPLSYLHVFPYSDRPGTEAAAMTPKVSTQDCATRARTRLRESAPGFRRTIRAGAGRLGAARPDAGRRHARADRQLPEGAHPAGPARATRGSRVRITRRRSPGGSSPERVDRSGTSSRDRTGDVS